MRERTVLVTGAGGFIGGAVARRLAAHGAAVVGAGRGNAPPHFPGRWQRTDLSNPAAVRSLVAEARASWVFHLAGRTVGAQGTEAVWPTFNDNLLATLPLLLALTESSCERLVLTASLRDPTDPLEPVPLSPYAASKAASSAYGRMFHRLYGLPVVIARLFMVYGPGSQDESKLLPYLLRKLLAGQEAHLTTGTAAFDFVFVDDVAQGIIALAERAGIEGETFDLGTGGLTSVATLASLVAARVGRPDLIRFGAIDDRRFEPTRAAQAARTARLTGWSPQTTLEEGLERTVAWFRRESGARQ